MREREIDRSHQVIGTEDNRPRGVDGEKREIERERDKERDREKEKEIGRLREIT